MKQRSQSLGYIILFFGIALIFIGFFILIPEEKRNHVFWLDLVVVSLIYFVNYVNIFGILGIYFDFDKQIAGLGIRLVYIRLYSIFALAVVFICGYTHIDFKYQLYLQLLGGFFLTITFFLSQLSSGKAISVGLEQDNLRKGKEDILKAITQFEILFSKDSSKWINEKKKIDFLKEEVRYLSPSNNQSAFELDNEIISEIKKAYDFASNKNEVGAEVLSLFTKCEELLKLRKNIYSN